MHNISAFFIIWFIQIRSASLLSLPLPILIFLWALFMTPHPHKEFWIIVIIYTQIMIVIKCICAFQFIPIKDESSDDNPFETARFIGVSRSSNYVIYELVLLMVVLMHRLMLKSVGLWNPRLYRSPSQLKLGIFRRLMIPFVHVPRDVYVWLFLCSFINFFILLFGFYAFGVEEPDSSLATLFERNKIPVLMLVLLLMQFFIIIIDRVIYVTRSVRARIIMHFTLVVFIHSWLFFILPSTTKRPFNSSVFPQVFYMVQCVYFVASAYQIRCGFPSRVFGNVLFDNYEMHNYVFSKVYSNIPFLNEVRGVMDWMFVTTSMSVTTYLSMEDIYSHIYIIKCNKVMDEQYGRHAATEIHHVKKWFIGGLFLLLVFALIWLPLYIFIIGMAAGSANLPHSVAIVLEVEGHTPIYRGIVQSTHINGLTSDEWHDFKNLYTGNRKATSFLGDYDFKDVAVVSIPGNSTSSWDASPADQARLVYAVTKTDESLTFILSWTVTSTNKDSQHTGVSEGSRKFVLTGNDANRKLLAQILTYDTSVSFPLPRMIPKFLEITNQDSLYPIHYMLPGASNDEDAYREIELRFFYDNDTKEDWWEMREANCEAPTPEVLQELPQFSSDCHSILVYTFNEKVLPYSLTKLISGKGVIALYITLIYVISKKVRSVSVTSVSTIMFKRMQNVDRLLQMCVYLYLARDYGELEIEEYLYAQLVFLFRSPETLIRWTRNPEEIEIVETQ